MTLSPDGLLFANLQAPLPWSAIEEISFPHHGDNRAKAVVLSLHLVAGFVPPAFSGDRRMKYRPKKGDILITTMGIKGHEPDAFAELTLGHWRGGLARAELEEGARLPR
jgi:hypothetical protein